MRTTPRDLPLPDRLPKGDALKAMMSGMRIHRFGPPPEDPQAFIAQMAKVAAELRTRSPWGEPRAGECAA